MISMKLRDFISKVRSSKTAAEERSVISKESANLRTSFRDEDVALRHRNIAKLLYIHMLGYPSHFGQMECLKSIASPRFVDKQIGYLALSLIVEKTSEILMLVTNSLFSDLNNPKASIQALAISTLANINEMELLKNLSSQVTKFLNSSVVYIKKKAIICTIKIIKYSPELFNDISSNIFSLLSDPNQSIQLSAINFLLSISYEQVDLTTNMQTLIPLILNNLQMLTHSTQLQSYDVNGISNPYLQVTLLRLLGVLGKNFEEELANTLIQVATKIEKNCNVGYAVLYECTRTIFRINPSNELIFAAISILGRFLKNKNNNIRYVALKVLSNVIMNHKQHVVKYQDIILECLYDSDISIRIRAAGIVFFLIDKNNIESLVTGVLCFLNVAPKEQKKKLATSLHEVCFLYSLNRFWHISTLITILCITDNQAVDSIWHTCISLIGLPDSEEYRPQIVHRLYHALRDYPSQLPLVYVAIWSIGEFGTLLLKPVEALNDLTEEYFALNECDVIDVLVSTQITLKNVNLVNIILLNAYIKLYTFFSNSESRIHKLLQAFQTNTSTELQTRSCEYLQILSPSIDSKTREEWLAQMPVPTIEELQARIIITQSNITASNFTNSFNDNKSDSDDIKTINNSFQNTSKVNDLLNLGEIVNYNSQSEHTISEGKSIIGSLRNSTTDIDFLQEIFGNKNSGIDKIESLNITDSDNVLNMSKDEQSIKETIIGNSEEPQIIAYDKNHISILLSLKKGLEPKEIVIQCIITNSSECVISNFILQAAVPKFQTLKTLESPSGNILEASKHNCIKQNIHVINPMQGQKPLALRVKILYSSNGKDFEDVFTVRNFPEGY